MPCKYNLRKRGSDPLFDHLKPPPPPPPDADPPPPEKDQAVEPTTPKRLLRRRRVSSSTEEESNFTATMVSEAKESPMEGVRKYNLRKRGFAPLKPLPPPPPPLEKDIPFGCGRTEWGDSFEEKVNEKMIPMMEAPDDEGSTFKRKADPESSPPTIMSRRSTSEPGRFRRSSPLFIRQMKSDEDDSIRDESLSLVQTESSKNSKVCELEDDNGAGDTKGEVVTRNKVWETLRLFQAICRKLLQEESSKAKLPGENVNGFRIDLSASKLMKEKRMWVNTGKAILGVVPGVEVGDEFQYRVELSIVGIHRLFQGGIDYLKKGEEILATSVVASGGYGYDDETESSDVLIYSGAGGTGGGKGEKKVEDQKLERGNLALKNSIHARSPVRVIRGFKELKHETRRPKVVTNYTYDGLYMVEKYWHEQGKHGWSVFKFQLRRILGQPKMAIMEVKKSKKSRVREGTVLDDISMGEEKLPICVVNTVDGELPPPFKYTTRAIHHPWDNLSSPRGCDCTNGCSNSNHCTCAVKNGGEIPFNFNGAIVEAKPLVYECGPSCKCPPSCHNRVPTGGVQDAVEGMGG
ncbi:Histone-lysine N-methyltransferase, H3 lysine-9 specific SUVH5 [Acorus calamus]|uniref:Histone-lysine N-methyltransferase, H3 lysine-9 specific SUVH5 n=1 Tax=Acorus calamus TaxID=4465 RepID=A0AAV9CLC7_ACOCL|nr:Histone-lysine N-methyltransferase, H3 lysine-9 specific SUVH5 [Acorus calamus]